VTAQRQGWFGGTFDPIHAGHVDVARAARTALDLERLHLAPAGVPPHRGRPVASADHRFRMATLAAAPYDWMVVSTIELAAQEPSYTMDTLDRLADRGMDLRTLYIITGADAFADILTWKDAMALLDRCAFIVVSRPGHPAPALRDLLPTLAGRMWNADAAETAPHPSILLVDAATAPVTSTDVRARVADGRPIAGLVPDSVADYIRTNSLYQGGV